MVSRKVVLVCVVFGVIADLAVSTISYGEGSERELRRNLIFVLRGFDFCSNQFDLWLLCLIRTSLVLGFVLGILWHPVTAVRRGNIWSIVTSCMGLAMASYSPVKLLALAETKKPLNGVPWFWTLFTWNLLSSLFFILEWVILCRTTPPATLIVDVEEDCVPILNEDDLESSRTGRSEKKSNRGKLEEEPKLTRREAFSLVRRLLKYCSAEWLLYLLGFIFLFIYSAGKRDITFTLISSLI